VVTRQIQLPPLPASAEQVDSPTYLQRLTAWRERAAQQLMGPSRAGGRVRRYMGRRWRRSSCTACPRLEHGVGNAVGVHG
jgi:hypothetical protein